MSPVDEKFQLPMRLWKQTAFVVDEVHRTAIDSMDSFV